MYHYKIKIKAFDSKAELWIALTAKNISEAVIKAHERCVAARNIFYALEHTVHQITQSEYELLMKKSLGSTKTNF